jgi:heterodisulfide reductase subunit B
LKLAVFWGCRIMTSQYAYEMSVRKVLPRFGVELVELQENLCCGDPVKSVNDFAADYLAGRVLALTSSTGLKNLLVPCNRCHFVISEAKSRIESDERVGSRVKGLLDEEGLKYDSGLRIWHVIDLLYDHVGLDSIKKAISRPLKELRLATHVGCQIVRYSDLGRVDDAENPHKLDRLIAAVGAKTVDYPEKLDCCGAALTYTHLESALSLTASKLKAVQSLGVDGLVVSCPDCGMMFDFKQKDAATTAGAKISLPVVYYTQLLGLALDIEQKKLGLQLNQSPVDRLLAKIPN